MHAFFQSGADANDLEEQDLLKAVLAFSQSAAADGGRPEKLACENPASALPKGSEGTALPGDLGGADVWQPASTAAASSAITGSLSDASLIFLFLLGGIRKPGFWKGAQPGL